MKKILILICIFPAFISCQKSSSCCTFNDLSLFMKVSSSNGQDLLNPTDPESLKESDLTLLYLRDGEFEPFFDNKLDDKKNLRIIYDSKTNTYLLRIYVDYMTDKNSISTTLLKLGNLRTDTILTTLSTSGSSSKIINVNLNNKVVDRDSLEIVLPL